MRRTLLASFILALAACNPSTPAADAAVANDAATATDAGHDAALAADTGPPICQDGFANCTLATAMDATAMTSVSITVLGGTTTDPIYRYSPNCIRVHTGTTISIQHGGVHPLASASCAPADSPLLTTPTADPFTFSHPGRYGYFCQNHGANEGTGMSGLIIVE